MVAELSHSALHILHPRDWVFEILSKRKASTTRCNSGTGRQVPIGFASGMSMASISMSIRMETENFYLISPNKADPGR